MTSNQRATLLAAAADLIEADRLIERARVALNPFLPIDDLYVKWSLYALPPRAAVKGAGTALRQFVEANP